MVEFIELEHTAKNLLLRAVRRPEPDRPNEAAAEAYGALKQSLGLDEIATDRIIVRKRRRSPRIVDPD